MELNYNKSFYLFIVYGTRVEAKTPFTKPFFILMHPSICSFAQYVIKYNLVIYPLPFAQFS